MGNVKEKRHWWILCGCTLLNFAGIGIIINTLGLYFNPIIEDMGYSRTAVSMLVTILTFVNMLVMFFIGKLYKKYSAKRLILIFGLIAGVSYAIYSMCNTINQFYICAALVGLGVGGSTVVPASILVTRWFNEKRGFALGIAFSGSGLGGMVFAPISTKLIYTYGYKTAFLAQGISIIILFVLACFIIENSPENIGLKPYGYKKVDEDENTNKKLGNYGLSFKEARKKPYFYGLMITGLIIGTTNLGILTQIPSFLIMNGYGENFAALVVTLFNAALIFGKLAYGYINDKIGTYKGNIYVISLWAAAIAILPFAANMHFIPYLYIIFAGLGNPVGTVSLPIWVGEVFGEKDYEVIYPAFALVNSLGLAFGSPISGMIADKTGSFNFAFIGFAVSLVIALIILQISYKAGKKNLKTIKNY